MGWILFKRAIRDIKDGAARYIALSLLIIFSIFIVVSLMGAAITVIDITETSDELLCREDGEFSVFVPLRDDELKKITDKGISVEKMFYTDYQYKEDKILRAFKVRENINRISVVSGVLPSGDNEVVLERRFAEVNNIVPGDVISVGGHDLSVCGIGAAPDYNTVYRKLSDTVVDSSSFGLFFVTPAMYDELLSEGKAVSSEEYYYAYKLNGAMTDDELRTLLEDNKFEVDDTDDAYFKEYWNRMTSDKDDLLEGIDELKDGARELADGADELADGTKEYHDGMKDLKDAMPDLKRGAKALNDGADSLEKGVKAYTSGVDSASKGATSLAGGMTSLKTGISTLRTGASKYRTGIKEFAASTGTLASDPNPYIAGVGAALKKPVSGLKTGFGSIFDGIDKLKGGAGTLDKGASSLSGGLLALRRNSKTLYSGAASLHSGTRKLKNGIADLSDGVNELYDASGEIRDGSSDLADGAHELYDGVKEFADEANDLVDKVFDIETSNLMVFIDHAENPRIDSAADDVQINLTASIIFGVLLVMLFAYVISVFIVHTIDGESPVIGALYSMGLKRRTLTLSSVSVPVLVSLISGIIGTLTAIGTPIGIMAQLNDTLGYFSMPAMEIKITPFILIYGIVVPPVTAFIVNVTVIRKRLKKSPLSLLRNEQKAVKGRDLKIRGLKFINMFRLRQMIREVRSGLTVVLGLFMGLLIAFLALNTYVYCSKVNEYYVDQTKFEYMYNYKYPSEKAPEGGYEAVAENLKKEIYGYTFDVTLLGITKDNPFFDTGDLPDNDTDLVLSSAVAVKYNLNVGDEFTLSNKNGDRLYAFRVAKIFDFSALMMVFMDIDRCRDMFGKSDDHYDVVFSDHELDIPSGRLYSVLTKEDIRKSAGIYVSMMGPMITTMSVASAVIFIVVMYLMMKMMLDRSAFNIALVKILGFKNREVRKMYLDGNFFTVFTGALISIPLCKMIMDYIYPRYLVSNVGVGITPSYPPVLYVIIFAVIIVLYFIINNLLVGRIRRIRPIEVLKNRE